MPHALIVKVGNLTQALADQTKRLDELSRDVRALSEALRVGPTKKNAEIVSLASPAAYTKDGVFPGAGGVEVIPRKRGRPRKHDGDNCQS